MSTGAAADDGELVLTDVGRFFQGFVAVERCNLSVGRGEILALLGPSGCGKSTLLNLIAGFEPPDTGEIRLRGKRLNDVPPHRRNIAMVFQHYAMFPHLTVARNISYGLEARRLDRATINARVAEMLALLKLTGLEKRYPAQLSGGQRQRVAIARALAIQPDVLLLDESFSALDRNLREEMQLELSLLLRRLKVTTILVTHDQREAFSLADRVAVMQAGRIAQIGTAREMYEQPRSDYILRFLGSTNSLNAELDAQGAAGARVRIGSAMAFDVASLPETLNGHAAARLHLRTEDVEIHAAPTAMHPHEPARVALSTFLGAQERIVLTLTGQQVVVDRPSRGPADAALPVGAYVYLSFNASRCHLTAIG